LLGVRDILERENVPPGYRVFNKID